MTSDRDPLIAQALDRLVAGLPSDPDEAIRRARATAGTLQQRRAARLRRSALLAFAALVLVAGAAFAASQFDALPWLDRSDRSSATFSVDSSRSYRGPAPKLLLCRRAGAGSFSCSLGTFPSSSRRIYSLAERVETQPQVSRESYLRAVATAEQKRQVDAATAARVRRDIDGAGDDFFAALATLAPVETVGAGEGVPGRPGFELVPPIGVPMWIACEAFGAGFRCHDLASSRDVAVGTPLYFLQASSDWVVVRQQSQAPIDVRALFHAALGRELRPAEARLLVDLITLGTSESGATRARPVPASPTKKVSP
jgi:hypothetical protein